MHTPLESDDALGFLFFQWTQLAYKKELHGQALRALCMTEKTRYLKSDKVGIDMDAGGCLYKGINRAIATLSAGGLAVGIDWVASKSGENWEPVILSASVFLLGMKLHLESPFSIILSQLNKCLILSSSFAAQTQLQLQHFPGSCRQ